QAFHNAYEESKHEAERLLRAEGGLRLTVYRPSVIVGDSVTGYTSSYAGAYRFFELADRLAGMSAHDPADGIRSILVRLPFTGEEHCDLVPVDWVARAVVALLDTPHEPGQTFHLVGQGPTTLRLLREAVCDELRLRGVVLAGPAGMHVPSRLETLVREGL